MTTSEHTIEALYKKVFPIVREKCRRMLSDYAEAEDIAQETFIRFYQHREKLQSDAVVLSWVYRTSTRLAIDVIRSARRRRELPSSDSLSYFASSIPFDPEMATQHKHTLTLLEENLPKDLLEVLILWKIDGLDQAEIAEVIGVSDRTVRRLTTKLSTRIEHLLSTKKLEHL